MLPPPLPAPPAIPEDFPDRVSPMIVKEVRQGLRGRMFITSFLLLHGVLLLWAAGFLSDTSRSGARGSDSAFWTIVAVGLVAIVSRANSAVRGERDGRTLELLRLTGIGARPVVTGKWGAIMIEAAIMVAGVLPYFVLRYYFGTLRPAEDALTLALLLVAVGVFAAMLTMVSCLGKLVGGIARAGLFFLGFVTFQGLFFAFNFGVSRGGFGGNTSLAVALGVSLAIPYCMIFLGVAASAIASVSENTLTAQRLWGLALLLPPVVALALGEHTLAPPLMFAALPGLLVTVFESILRRSNPSLPVYAERLAPRRPLRAMAWMLAPTRGAGILYTLVCWTAVAALCTMIALKTVSSGDKPARIALAMFCCLNALLLPAALGTLLGRMARFPAFPFAARYWVSFFILTVPVVAISALLMGQLADAARVALTLFPLGALAMNTRDDMPAGLLGVTCAGHLVFWVVVLLPFVLRDLAALRLMLRGERAPLPTL